MVGEVFFAAVGGGGLDFFEDILHEGLSAEAGDDGHAEEEVDFVEVGDEGLEGGCGVEGEAGEAAGFADAFEGFGDVVFGFDVDGDEVGAGLDEAWEVVIGA